MSIRSISRSIAMSIGKAAYRNRVTWKLYRTAARAILPFGDLFLSDYRAGQIILALEVSLARIEENKAERLLSKIEKISQKIVENPIVNEYESVKMLEELGEYYKKLSIALKAESPGPDRSQTSLMTITRADFFSRLYTEMPRRLAEDPPSSWAKDSRNFIEEAYSVLPAEDAGYLENLFRMAEMQKKGKVKQVQILSSWLKNWFSKKRDSSTH